MNALKDWTMPYALFERFDLQLSRREAAVGSHRGKCDDDIADLRTVPHIAAQLAALDPAAVRAELRETGGWDDAELADDDANLSRILWIACGNIQENYCE